jgi:hypothetical protein
MADEVAEEVNEETQVEPETEAEVETTPEEKVEEPKEPVKEETPVEEPKPEEIPVRSNASYIIQRQKAQIEKLRAEKVEEEPTSDVEARLERIEQMTLGQADDRDLLTFFDKEPEAKKYESRIKAYMTHDAYKGVAPEVIYHHLSYNDARTEASNKRKAADLEARQTRSAGSSVRETRSRDEKTASEIKNMTDKEFREYEQEVQRKARA